MKHPVNIRKYSGDLVPYDKNKLISSLRHAGAGEELAMKIEREVAQQLHEGITTKKIYSMAFQRLKKSKRATASRYKTKKAIMELGPSGFPFERFIQHIFSHDGYLTESGVFMKGNCATHELDVIARKELRMYLIECKYHNTQGRVSDIKVPLYFQSRFEDVKRQLLHSEKGESKDYSGWIITNTRFTRDAETYGKCVGLEMISWDYPAQKCLRDRINRSKLFPITALTTLTKREKSELLSRGVVLCKELYNRPELFKKIGVSEMRKQKVLEDILELCDAHLK